MRSPLRDVAESRFDALTRREKSAMNDVDTERLATQEKTARLKALRLAKEAETIAAGVAGFKKRRTADAS